MKLGRRKPIFSNKTRDRSKDIEEQKTRKNNIIAFRNYSAKKQEERVEPNYQDQDETTSFNMSPISSIDLAKKKYKIHRDGKKTPSMFKEKKHLGYQPRYEICTRNTGSKPKPAKVVNLYCDNNNIKVDEPAQKDYSSPVVSRLKKFK